MSATLDRVIETVRTIDADNFMPLGVDILCDQKSGCHRVEGRTLQVEFRRGYALVTAHHPSVAHSEFRASVEINSTGSAALVKAARRASDTVKILTRVAEVIEGKGLDIYAGTSIDSNTVARSGLRVFNKDWKTARVHAVEGSGRPRLFVDGEDDGLVNVVREAVLAAGDEE